MTDISTSNWFRNAIRLLGLRNEVLQIAALPCRVRNGELQVCLITSRRTRRWIIPKGWPEPDLSHSDTAKLEAWEEAGLEGKVVPETFASYKATKDLEDGLEMPIRMDVYLMIEPEQKKRFPEVGQRKVKWLCIDKASERISDEGLRRLLIQLKAQGLPVATST